MTDISAWLLAIYAEQEKVARQCACGAKSGSLDCLGRAHLSHFAVADIATRKETLADLAAKKAIVEAYQEAATLWEATGSERSLPAASIDGAFVALEHAVRLLAFAHADKPGYQAEWGVG